MRLPPARSFQGENTPVLYRLLSILVVLAASGCSVLPQASLPTPLPSQYLPTAVALTLAANRPAHLQDTTAPSRIESSPTGTPTVSSTPTLLQTPSATLPPSATPTITPTGPTPKPRKPTPTPYPRKPTFTPTITATPEAPNAEIEIRNLGPLSRVKSPLHVYLYMKPGAGGKVSIELSGEDGRILYREIRKINFVPTGAWATFTVDFEFEIAATAEAGRLKISVADEYGRTVALNSVPLILLSLGEADIVPPRDLLAPIIIRQPKRKALIQGGKLVVSGFARPEGSGPLMVKLVTAQGAEPGFRLAEVGAPGLDGYSEFAVEVPYTVSKPTPALLVVEEGASSLSDVIHLSSFEVLLSP
jgi:hypothetical protein